VKIEKNHPLKSLNTFGVEAYADVFVRIIQKQQLVQLFSENIIQQPLFILGGGSNVLFTGNFRGTVVKMDTRGIEKSGTDGTNVYIKVAAGEPWDDVVAHCCLNGWHGLENLSLIPGCAGASPVQNVGAFGIEAADRIEKVEVFDRTSITFKELSADECGFGYRDSRFKHDWTDKYIVTAVIYALTIDPEVILTYEALKNSFSADYTPTPQEVRQAVIHIRESRLPDVKKTGNAGSFFKNPVVGKEKFENLKTQFPDIIHYPAEDNKVKLAAGWLIEKAGWKGKRHGNAGVHVKQALVLVNHGNATSKEIIELSQRKFQSRLLKFLELNCTKKSLCSRLNEFIFGYKLLIWK
jgi:UDP-N-acetylmuramate dehydrogenase